VSAPTDLDPGAATAETAERAEAAEMMDGRRLRSERSRAAVVEALLDLYAEGALRPGAAEIAARAGVSERSVFRHFDDLDALVEAGIARQLTRIGHLFATPSTTGTRAARVAALVDQRLAVHDAAGNSMRATLLILPDSPRMQANVERRRRHLADQIDVVFAKELDGRDRADRAELRAALAATASIEHIEHLRTHLGLTRSTTRAVLMRTITALLSSRKATA
jgi:AcrR family transcriptional regulator